MNLLRKGSGSLSEMKKALYFGNQYYTQNVTKLGAIETDLPNLYANGVKGKVVIRIDTLTILKDIVGEEIFKDRNRLYKLVSASGVTNKVYQILFERAYLESERFRFYVDGQFLFKNPEENLLSVVISPLREKVDKYQIALFNQLTNSGFKCLMTTHDYVYYATSKAPIPDIEGLIVI